MEVSSFELSIHILSEDINRKWIFFQEEIASLRGIKTTTVTGHIAEAISVGLEADLDRLGITNKMQELITSVIRNPPINSGRYPVTVIVI